MNVTIDLENASSGSTVPRQAQFESWAQAALDETVSEATQYLVTIRIVNENESADLNQHYRDKQGPTNILSFPAGDDFVFPGAVQRPLGDLAICAPVVNREAREQDKTTEAHWAHMTVHGLLHLQGYDHEAEEEAVLMEALEVRILATLGYNNPYNQETR